MYNFIFLFYFKNNGMSSTNNENPSIRWSGFETAIPSIKQPQTHVLDLTVIGISISGLLGVYICRSLNLYLLYV